MRVSAELVESSGEQRRSERRSTGLRSWLRSRGSTGSLPVHVVDISTAGCRVEVRPAPFQGSTVWLKLPGLEAWCGQVAWVGKDCVGLEFSQPLHSAVVDRFLALRR